MTLVYPFLVAVGVLVVAYVTTEDKSPTALRDSLLWTLAAFVMIAVAMLA